MTEQEQEQESITAVKMGINSALTGRYKPDAIKASISNMSMLSSTLASQGAQLHNFILIHEVQRGNELTYDMITDPNYMYAIYSDNVLPVEVRDTIRRLHFGDTDIPGLGAHNLGLGAIGFDIPINPHW